MTPVATATQKESGFAPFFSFEYQATEALEVFGGIRWNRDRFFLDRIDPGTSVQPVDLMLRASDKFRETTYEVGLRYEFTEDISVYGKFTHGYKAGLLELDISGAVAQIQAVPPVPLDQVDFENSVPPELIDAF